MIISPPYHLFVNWTPLGTYPAFYGFSNLPVIIDTRPSNKIVLFFFFPLLGQMAAFPRVRVGFFFRSPSLLLAQPHSRPNSFPSLNIVVFLLPHRSSPSLHERRRFTLDSFPFFAEVPGFSTEDRDISSNASDRRNSPFLRRHHSTPFPFLSYPAPLRLVTPLYSPPLPLCIRVSFFLARLPSSDSFVLIYCFPFVRRGIPEALSATPPRQSSLTTNSREKLPVPFSPPLFSPPLQGPYGWSLHRSRFHFDGFFFFLRGTIPIGDFFLHDRFFPPVWGFSSSLFSEEIYFCMSQDASVELL